MSASQPQSAMARRDGPPSDAWLRSLSRLNAEARALSLEPDGVTPVEQVLARCKEHLDASLDLSKDPRVPDVFVDLFELMRFELHDLRRGLHRLDDASNISTVLETCDRVRGGIVRSTDIVALSCPEDLGAAEDLQDWRQRIARDVTTALLVRRLYTVFRRQMRVNLEGSQERELVAALRRVSTQIEVVRRQPEFRSFRLHDQQSFLALQRRLIEWLQQRSPRNVEDGRRVLSDVGAFAGLLRGINHRHVLVDFDRTRLQAFRNGIVGGRELPRGAWNELFFATRLVWGRDDEFDELLESTEPMPRSAWLGAVERVLDGIQSQPFDCVFPAPADHPMMVRTAWSTFLPSPPPLPL